MTETAPSTPEPSASKPSWSGRVRARLTSELGRVTDWVEHSRTQRTSVDLGARVYERDRDTFASVLGSALALRLFLFFVPSVLAVVSLLSIFGADVVDSAVEQAAMGGTVTDQVQGAVASARDGRFLLLATGLFTMAWAGRSLAKVLVAASAGAWGLPGRSASATVRIAASVTGLVFGLLVITAILNRIRDQFGVAIATTSLLATVVIFAAVWFAVTLTLPRPTPDPGALLPGALLVGGGLALLQWFMQFYLPGKIARSSEIMGGIGVTVATLGYLFFIGRLMVGSFVLNAVMWERVGSISAFVFALPGVRRIPRRWPRVAQFFDLDHQRAEGAER